MASVCSLGVLAFLAVVAQTGGDSQLSGLTLGQWLATTGDIVTGPASNLIVVAGNEASDADSIVTAIVLGYLRALTAPEGSGPVVPLVACHREDVTLRSETVDLLRMSGVDHHDMTFLPDHGMDEVLGRVGKVILTDHNKATGPLEVLSDKVQEIHDHHKDLGHHLEAPCRNIAFFEEDALRASAATLVAEEYFALEGGQELLARDGGAAARALLGVILIDSYNLDPKKAKPEDVVAAEALAKIAPTPDQAKLFRELDEAKYNKKFWRGLGIEQALRYDYKEFAGSGGERYGLASCLCPLEQLAAKHSWHDAVVNHGSKLDMYGILTLYKDGETKGRQLMIYAANETVAAGAAAFAQAYATPSLSLESLQIQGPPNTHAFSQGNLAASRKQVQPCISEFFSHGMAEFSE